MHLHENCFTGVSVTDLKNHKVWDAINDGTIYSCPSLLASFVVLSFADLKKYHFSYWFAFPAIHSTPSWTPSPSTSGGALEGERSNNDASYWRHLTTSESSTLVDAVQTWRYTTDSRQHGFFLARKNRLSMSGTTPNVSIGPESTSDPPENARSSSADDDRSPWSISPLSGFDSGFFKAAPEYDCFVCFADPSNYADAPGWMLRNLLILVRQRWNLNRVNILRYRDVQSRRDQARSMTMTLESVQPQAKNSAPDEGTVAMPKVTGWERNASGKLSGRVVDLTAYMDPARFVAFPVE